MRVRVIELECEGAQALEMVRELAGMAQRQPEPEHRLKPMPRALAAPRETVARPAKAGPTKEDDGLGQKGALQNLALAALREGPKTSREVASWIKAKGHPYTDTRAGAMLSYLGKRKRVRRTGGHLSGRWELM